MPIPVWLQGNNAYILYLLHSALYPYVTRKACIDLRSMHMHMDCPRNPRIALAQSIDHIQICYILAMGNEYNEKYIHITVYQIITYVCSAVYK